MKKELIVMLGAAVLGTVCCSNMTADKVSAKTSGDYKYVITGKKQKTCAIRKYTGKDKDVNVPEKLDGYTVTRIGNTAFARNKKIQSVKLPKHITVIGEKSFSGCSNLESITLSPKLHTIRNSAFSSCKNLNDIGFSSTLKKIEKNAFYNCRSLKEIKLPDSVEKIGESAFYGCNEASSIYIPKNLGETDLRTVFNNNTITKITVADGNKFYDSRDNCNAVIKTASDKLIFGTKDSTIPDSVKVIGSEAFADCSTMKTFTVPSTVSKIEEFAFENCSGLETVKFSDGLTSIGESAFSNCSSLKEIKLPDTLVELGDSAFYDCNKVDSIYIPRDLIETDLSLVFECRSATKITVADGNKTYDSRDNCNAIIETADNKLIYGTDNSSIPDSVTAIGKEAFSDCINMKEITIPASIRSIEDSAFFYCTGLEKINFSEGLTSIDDNAFYNCISLKEIRLPDSLETLGDSAFYRCEKVTGIYIPKNLGKTDLPFVFECDSVAKIDVAAGNKYYDSRNNCNAVIETDSNTLVYACKNTVIPNTVKVIGAFAYTNAPSEIVIPDGVVKILNNAFMADDSIKTVTIPVSVKEIGNDSFDNGLETVNYKGSKAQWKKIKINIEKDEDDEFYFVNRLEDVKINYNYKG